MTICTAVLLYLSWFLTMFQFVHNFFSIVGFVRQFYFTILPQNVHDFSLSHCFSCPFTRTLFLTIYLILSKLYGTLIHFVSQFSQCPVIKEHFSVFKYHKVRTGIFSKIKSRQKWAHQSVPFCIYYLGFILLLCYGDLHCFNSFIISDWLAICSG